MSADVILVDCTWIRVSLSVHWRDVEMSRGVKWKMFKIQSCTTRRSNYFGRWFSFFDLLIFTFVKTFSMLGGLQHPLSSLTRKTSAFLWNIFDFLIILETIFWFHVKNFKDKSSLNRDSLLNENLQPMIVVSRLNRNWIELWKGVVWYIRKKLGRKAKSRRKCCKKSFLVEKKETETSPKRRSRVQQQHMKPKRKERRARVGLPENSQLKVKKCAIWFWSRLFLLLAQPEQKDDLTCCCNKTRSTTRLKATSKFTWNCIFQLISFMRSVTSERGKTVRLN